MDGVILSFFWDPEKPKSNTNQQKREIQSPLSSSFFPARSHASFVFFFFFFFFRLAFILHLNVLVWYRPTQIYADLLHNLFPFPLSPLLALVDVWDTHIRIMHHFCVNKQTHYKLRKESSRFDASMEERDQESGSVEFCQRK
jgi:hypothetical protein